MSTIKNILPPGSVIFTLKEKKPNEILKVGDVGITVRTEGSPKIILKDLIKKAWTNLVKHGILYQRDHEKSTYRSSFILALFSQFDLVNIRREGPLCVTLNSAESKNIEEAEAYYENVLEIDSKEKDALLKKGLALVNLDKFDKAIECYERALEIDPIDRGGWYLKGLALVSLKKYEEAIESLDIVLENNPEDKDGWYFKGVALESLKSYQQAIVCYTKALEIYPGFKEALNSKAAASEKLKKY